MITLKQISSRLKQYEEQEARSIVRLLLFDCFNISFTDICSGALDRMSVSDKTTLDEYLKRLESGEPIQYVIGKETFYDREFHVAPEVLIPRPETETLISEVINYANNHKSKRNILDIGTGSGCIAITLSKEIDHANITAWDISDAALIIARENATRIGADIEFQRVDILNNNHEYQYDIIVSNPPYICEKEKEEMEDNVLCHEPHIALFVPDEDPLLFYRYITEYAQKNLSDGGLLAFEINPLYAQEIKIMMNSLGFKGIKILNDEFGKQRVITGEKYY